MFGASWSLPITIATVRAPARLGQRSIVLTHFIDVETLSPNGDQSHSLGSHVTLWPGSGAADWQQLRMKLGVGIVGGKTAFLGVRVQECRHLGPGAHLVVLLGPSAPFLPGLEMTTHAKQIGDLCAPTFRLGGPSSGSPGHQDHSGYKALPWALQPQQDTQVFRSQTPSGDKQKGSLQEFPGCSVCLVHTVRNHPAQAAQAQRAHPSSPQLPPSQHIHTCAQSVMHRQDLLPPSFFRRELNPRHQDQAGTSSLLLYACI